MHSVLLSLVYLFTSKGLINVSDLQPITKIPKATKMQFKATFTLGHIGHVRPNYTHRYQQRIEFMTEIKNKKTKNKRLTAMYRKVNLFYVILDIAEGVISGFDMLI